MNAEAEQDLSFLNDLPVNLQVRLGEATLTVEEILKCGKGSVIQLDQKIGDPFSIILNNRKIAEGEIVEAGERLGVKVTKVIEKENSQEENGGES